MRFLHQPVNPWRVFQKFGENQACIDLETNSKVIACDGLNPPPGYRSVYGPKGHSGVDVWAVHNQPVYCACTGIVDSIDTNPRTGLDVKVVSEIAGRRFRHFYEHLLGYQPKKGDKIETGGLIGWADNTGYSSGNHLHFQLEEWFNNKWVPVDPEPYMFDAYALNVNQVKKLSEMVARLADLVADWLRRPKQ
jgi:murein DD-endopeptidase MepM/ murein hydrolase activator NlpD